jgi:hypothetical protein
MTRPGRQGTVKRLLTALALVGLLVFVTAPAAAKKHHSHKPAGVAGTVFNSTCAGACAEPPPPAPVYTGAVTITVTRASDGQQVASQAISDGHFKIRLKRGSYDVSSVPPNPPACEPQPNQVCPLSAQSAAVIAPCMQGETKRVQVTRHKFTHVDLHVSNVCIV